MAAVDEDTCIKLFAFAVNSFSSKKNKKQKTTTTTTKRQPKKYIVFNSFIYLFIFGL